ncbi:hypothetical protein ACOSQ2_015651 [Xanthoceras sorbifolium]
MQVRFIYLEKVMAYSRILSHGFIGKRNYFEIEKSNVEVHFVSMFSIFEVILPVFVFFYFISFKLNFCCLFWILLIGNLPLGKLFPSIKNNDPLLACIIRFFPSAMTDL